MPIATLFHPIPIEIPASSPKAKLLLPKRAGETPRFRFERVFAPIPRLCMLVDA